MNYKIIGHIIKIILFVEAVFMIPAMLLCLFDGDSAAAISFGITILLILAAIGVLEVLCRNRSDKFFAKEGLITTGASWIFMSLFGALPFWFCKEIPNFVDAFFEIVSGFTTTGASILTDIEALPRGLLYWRSFSHWLGGMGVLPCTSCARKAPALTWANLFLRSEPQQRSSISFILASQCSMLYF